MKERVRVKKLIVALLVAVTMLVTAPAIPGGLVYALDASAQGAESASPAEHGNASDNASGDAHSNASASGQASDASDSKDADSDSAKSDSKSEQADGKNAKTASDSKAGKSASDEEYIEEEIIEELEDEDEIEATVYTDDKQKKELKNIRITVRGDVPDDAEVIAYPVDVDIEGEETYAAYQLLIYDAKGKEYHSTAKDGKSIVVTIYDAKLADKLDKVSDARGWHRDGDDYEDIDFAILEGEGVEFLAKEF